MTSLNAVLSLWIQTKKLPSNNEQQRSCWSNVIQARHNVIIYFVGFDESGSGSNSGWLGGENDTVCRELVRLSSNASSSKDTQGIALSCRLKLMWKGNTFENNWKNEWGTCIIISLAWEYLSLYKELKVVGNKETKLGIKQVWKWCRVNQLKNTLYLRYTYFTIH